jgi:hypothetical protein
VDEQPTEVNAPLDEAPTVLEPAPAAKPARKRPAPVEPAKVTVRNRTRRVVVAVDATGTGLHLFPGVDCEIAADLLSPDIHTKVLRGLLTLE